MKNKITNRKAKITLSSSTFKKLFGIPTIIWTVLSLLALIPDESGSITVTWQEVIYADIVLILMWFTISFIISTIIIKLKSNNKKIKNENTLEQPKKDNNQKEAINTEIIESKKASNNKCLYTCESIIDSYEYKKMAKYFPKRMYWPLVINGSFINLLLSAIFAIIEKSFVDTLALFVIVEIFLLIIYKIKLEHFAEKVFNNREKKELVEKKFETEFYEDYFIRKDSSISLTIQYNEIERCVENDTNFYLEYPKNNMILIFQKNRCSLELVNFIRNKFKDTENHLGEEIKFKTLENYKHPNLIRNGMILLFILTITSLWGALYSVAIINSINPQHGFNFSKNLWVFWCWLPIPILSIILGFKFKKDGFKCTKNIVGGFIIGFLLLIYGSFSTIPTFEADYQKINNYKNIIDAALPKNGELEIQNWDTYFDTDKTEYSIINAYYDKEDITNLTKSIEENPNWIKSNNIKSELKIFIPSQLQSTDENSYYSIYNLTTKEYNTLPQDSGNYEIYTMKFNKSTKTLEIHTFKYSYTH